MTKNWVWLQIRKKLRNMIFMIQCDLFFQKIERPKHESYMTSRNPALLEGGFLVKECSKIGDFGGYNNQKPHAMDDSKLYNGRQLKVLALLQLCLSFVLA